MPFRGFGGYRRAGDFRGVRYRSVRRGDLADMAPDFSDVEGGNSVFGGPTEDSGGWMDAGAGLSSDGGLPGSDSTPLPDLSDMPSDFSGSPGLDLASWGIQIGGPNVQAPITVTPGTKMPGGTSSGIPTTTTVLPPGMGGYGTGHLSAAKRRTLAAFQTGRAHVVTRRVSSWLARDSRRMNPGNMHALRRAIHRASAFKHYASKVLKFTNPSPHARVKFKFHRRRRK